MSPTVRLLAIQLCEKFEESGTFESRDMTFVTPKKAPFLCLQGYLEFGSLHLAQNFTDLSVSWPYSCVKSLKKVGHSSLEIWAFVTPKKAPFLCLQGYLEFLANTGSLTSGPKFSRLECPSFSNWPYSCSEGDGLKKVGHSRYPCKHRKPYPKGQFRGSQRPKSRDSNVPFQTVVGQETD